LVLPQLARKQVDATASACPLNPQNKIHMQSWCGSDGLTDLYWKSMDAIQCLAC
jgi:hypothetical protein